MSCDFHLIRQGKFSWFLDPGHPKPTIAGKRGHRLKFIPSLDMSMKNNPHVIRDHLNRIIDLHTRGNGPLVTLEISAIQDLHRIDESPVRPDTQRIAF